jgi:tRNA pseudouridine55 synthase
MRNNPAQGVLTKEWVRSTGAASHEIIARISDGTAILIDKPKAWTSFDVVNKVRYTFRLRKVGHAGTLDPMATGLLIVCTGHTTKYIDSYVGLDKEYSGVCKLGEITPSYDAETEVVESRPVSQDITEKLEEAASILTGEIYQIPPMYSAVKVKGTRLYKLARKGKEIKRDPRKVFVKYFSVRCESLPFVQFRVLCSKGTYIRTLVYDFGENLGCGAHITQLQRVAVGSYTVNDAFTLDDLVRLNALVKGERS